MFNEYLENELNFKINKINEFIKNKNKIEITVDKLEINQLIYIIFTPDSLKYYYDLHPKIGTIINLDKNNINNILIKNFDNEIDNLFHDNVGSCYSSSLGYSYNIYIIK